MTDKPPILTLYGHASCAQVPTVRAILHQTGVPYAYIDIRQDTDAREHLRALNNGYESVPTLEFADGDTLTEPSGAQLQRKLKTLGYRSPVSAVLLSNWQWFVVAAGLMWFLLRIAGVA